MTKRSEAQKIEQECREYILHMQNQNKTPSAVYLNKKQIELLKKQAKMDGVKWFPVIDGLPIKEWNP